jgi:hypothetical protein
MSFFRQPARIGHDDVKITFFMIVTDPDIVIADYAVKSYAKIQGVRFYLRVYSNWVSSSLKRRYFPRWRKYSFVEIIEPEGQTDENKPTDRRLEGPFERCDTIWDRELKKIDTPYHATVDADFEILDAGFVPVMLARLDGDSNLIAISTDYDPTVMDHYDSYSDGVICLNERWHTWFCIYKRGALKCEVSHAVRVEELSGPVRHKLWDTSGYFQKALREDYGFELAVLEPRYQPCFIHYGAFSKNRNINAWNVALYRHVQILGKSGLFGHDNGISGSVDHWMKKAGNYLNRLCFSHIDRSKYWPGWGQG